MEEQYIGNPSNFNEDTKFFKDVYIYGNLYYDFTNLSNSNLIADNITTGNITITGTTNALDIFCRSLTASQSVTVSGPISASSYQNFELSDLPTTTEPSYGGGRVLRAKTDGSGYELVDSAQLDVIKLSGYGLSNDPTIYTGIGANESGNFKISGISTSRFSAGHKVKMFGVTATSDTTTVAAVPTGGCSFAKIGSSAAVTTYRYWLAQYNYRNGKIGAAAQITPTAGISMAAIGDFNDLDHISLTLARTDTSHGILVYRSESASINDAKLVAILGPKELQDATSSINWKDYGPYEKTEWSSKTIKNEYDEDQIHFPNIATTNQGRGWAIDTIDSVGLNYITVSNEYDTNIGIGTTAAVKLVHDNTYGFSIAIDGIVSAGGKSLHLPSGTYLTSKVVLPTGFTLKGDGKNTIIKQQYFANDETDGGGNSVSFDGNLIGISTTSPSDMTVQNLTIDGNNTNNILFTDDIDNYLVYFYNVSSTLLRDVEIRNSPGHGLYVYNSTRLSVENCEFVDGSLTDRYFFSPLNAQESEVLRINDSLFENYPGSVDLSVTTVVSTGGNIIRNCGTGLRTYATGKITTTNNIILGPSDEFIPSPDIYDSDYNSINFSIERGKTFTGPVLQYHENGNPKDISSSQVSVTSGISTIVNAGLSSETLGTKFLDFNITTPDSGTFGRQNGYIQLSLNSTQTSTLGLTSALGYEIVGTEFLSQPVGFTTYVAISSGTWNTIGAGATQYTVTLSDFSQFSGISVGDVVKLVNHSVSPDLSATELTVAAKINVSAATKQLRLTGLNVTSSTNGNATGYISIRNIFTIAKGRVGVL